MFEKTCEVNEKQETAKKQSETELMKWADFSPGPEITSKFSKSSFKV